MNRLLTIKEITAEFQRQFKLASKGLSSKQKRELLDMISASFFYSK